jgi:FtsP/CotA-like multicopper oxidase with cupredoxin domain
MPVDVNSGLLGPTIVYNRGAMDKTMASNRELVLLYQIYDETLSFLASTNEEKYGNGTKSMAMPVTLEHKYAGNMSFWKPQLVNMPTVTLSSTQAPEFHTLNGYTFANNPMFEMCLDESVVWYVYGFGAESHVFHMHGNSFKWHHDNMASKSLNDGNMMTLFMKATAGGTWQVLCHVSDHLSNGMQALYTVHGSGSACPLPNLSA